MATLSEVAIRACSKRGDAGAVCCSWRLPGALSQLEAGRKAVDVHDAFGIAKGRRSWP